MDRGPEVKTIRRKITALAATGRADELLAAMAATHVARLDATNPDLLAVFYVVRDRSRFANPAAASGRASWTLVGRDGD